MIYRLDAAACRNFDVASRREWLLTNGLGGYAMGTVAGANTRRYHGHLVAALTPPTKRWVLLAGLDAFVQTDGPPAAISTNQYPGTLSPEGYLDAESFAAGSEVEWQWRVAGARVRKTIALTQGENTATIRYSNSGVRPFLLIVRPLVCHRSHHGEFEASETYPDEIEFLSDRTVTTHGGVSLNLMHADAQRTPVQSWYYRFEHAREQERGLRARDDLYCPCELRWQIQPGEQAVLVASTRAGAAAARESHGEEEAQPHLLTPQLQAACDRCLAGEADRQTLIAGFPWFTDWGRDTMIALPGTCLSAERFETARSILRGYAQSLHQGLVPNRFVEEGGSPEYNTADATLWFVNAVYKTLLADWNAPFAEEMADSLDDVFRWHVGGTLHGIGIDPRDGLLRQGETGVQLTWMDARVGDRVITPRPGKPVEINGLWINALRCMEWLARQLGRDEVPFQLAASKAEASFDGSFWSQPLGHYLDTIDPVSASLRPNQVIAMALPFSPMIGEHALTALRAVERELLTPYGLRTLAPSDPEYRGRFEGALPELDSAYHQGTVWPWLLGPYATALVRLTGDRAEARRVLRAAREMLSDYGLGGIAEVYDGDGPQRPGGCPWQAWSAAEILRAWVEDAGGD